jgi:hypothetical protein
VQSCIEFTQRSQTAGPYIVFCDPPIGPKNCTTCMYKIWWVTLFLHGMIMGDAALDTTLEWLCGLALALVWDPDLDQ